MLKAGCSIVLGLVVAVHASQAADANMSDSLKIRGANLVLNGSGTLLKNQYPIYVAGLYLWEKKKSLQEIVALGGNKAIRIVMLRNMVSTDLSQSLIQAASRNLSNKAEMDIVSNGIALTAELIESTPVLNKGDILLIEWVPASGTFVTLNGQRNLISPFAVLFNTLLTIWLGDRRVSEQLKNQLLGLP